MFVLDKILELNVTSTYNDDEGISLLVGEESLPVQKEGALRKRSAILSHLLVMRLSRLARLFVQY